LQAGTDGPIGDRAHVAWKGFVVTTADSDEQDFAHQRGNWRQKWLGPGRQRPTNTSESFLHKLPCFVDVRVP